MHTPAFQTGPNPSFGDLPTLPLEEAPTVFALEFAGHLFRYVVLAGVAFLLFYVLLRRVAAGRKIQAAFARWRDIRREILYSLGSFAVFGLLGVLTFACHRMGWNRLYLNIAEYGWGYFVFSVVAIIFIHDAWFYWTHRLMHWRPVYRVVHRVHHMSHNPTPWAAFAFHPLEAVVEGAIFPLLVLVMPAHPFAAAIWLLYMTAMNVFGHLGYEILPRGFVSHPLTRWHNTSVHHNMHHSKFTCNYGLYFNIWDRLMGTNHAQYEQEYDRVTTVGRASRPSVPCCLDGRDARPTITNLKEPTSLGALETPTSPASPATAPTA